jgi:thioredoxin-related protein
MKKQLCLLVLSLPIVIFAQENRGIQWTEGLTWEMVKVKAKAANRYIFVDCYATWCGPCKFMDKNIYTDEKVGNYFNDKFISIKAQIDSSSKDNEVIKSWYSDAGNLKSKYNINAFPTFLFFSSEGKLVHKAIGGYGAERFISLASDALSPQKQYYNLTAEYLQGARDTSVMKQLARSAKELGDKDLAFKIVDDYISMLSKKELYEKENLMLLRDFCESQKVVQIASTYISELKGKALYSKNNIEFIRQFIYSSKDLGFRLFYSNVDTINKVMGDIKYSQGKIDEIIFKEEIDPILVPAKKSNGHAPDWKEIKKEIKRKYNAEYADRIISSAKLNWYGFKKDWPHYTKILILIVEKSGSKDDRMFINRTAWEIFKRSNDKKDLKTAISWMEHLFLKHENEDYYYGLDTYANLFYKLGRVEDAISWEEKAISFAQKNNDQYIKKEDEETLNKMRKGEPTWPIQ